MSWLGKLLVPVRVFGEGGSLERNALVDTGSETLGLPHDMAEELGLRFTGYRNMVGVTGNVKVPWIQALRIEVMGKSITTDAVVTPHGTPLLLGFKQLKALDLSLHPKQGEVR